MGMSREYVTRRTLLLCGLFMVMTALGGCSTAGREHSSEMAEIVTASVADPETVTGTAETAGAAGAAETAGTADSGSNDAGIAESVSSDITASADLAKDGRQGLTAAMMAAILEYNQGRYLEGEHPAAGFEILDRIAAGERLQIYALVSYGEYGFQDDNFVKVSGSGVIPTALSFQIQDNKKYRLLDYEIPEDGSGYGDSIREIFPETLWEQCLSLDEKAVQQVTEMEYEGAKSYLQSIGRDAEVGEYADFPHPLLTSQGVSVDVADMVTNQGDSLGYPYWIGNQEQVEDGVRYVYAMSYDREQGMIIFRKWNAKTGETVEKLQFDSMTGRKIEP